MGMKFRNNAATTLAAAVAPTDLTMQVNTTAGSTFPVLGAGDYFYCTLQSQTSPTTIEVVKVTAVVGNVFTMVRAQDGTTAQTFNLADKVELRIVAATLNDLAKLDEVNIFALGITFSDGSRLNTVNQLGFRNRAHNGNFAINQRAVASPTTIGAGVYGFDRWKAGPGGCTFSFAASGNGNIITITAGTLIHVVEDLNIEGGNYAVSHQGTAQVRFGINGAVPSGAFAAATTAAPVVSGVANAKQTVSVEFGVGTLNLVQIEPGTAASPFERRPYSVEFALCQRYAQLVDGEMQFYCGIAGQTTAVSSPLPVPMRAVPTVTLITAPGTALNVSSAQYDVATTRSVRFSVVAVNVGPTNLVGRLDLLSADL